MIHGEKAGHVTAAIFRAWKVATHAQTMFEKLETANRSGRTWICSHLLSQPGLGAADVDVCHSEPNNVQTLGTSLEAGNRKLPQSGPLIWDQCLLASNSSFKGKGKGRAEELTPKFRCADCGHNVS